MQRKTLANAECPIARSLERVGEWWSILIMRDALQGLRRFDEFARSLEIAPNMLTRRLNSLVEAGLLERQAYSQRPLRYQYAPTVKGEDFRADGFCGLGGIAITPRKGKVFSSSSEQPGGRCARSWQTSAMAIPPRWTSAPCKQGPVPVQRCACVLDPCRSRASLGQTGRSTTCPCRWLAYCCADLLQRSF